MRLEEEVEAHWEEISIGEQGGSGGREKFS